jgi:hypothetical protein
MVSPRTSNNVKSPATSVSNKVSTPHNSRRRNSPRNTLGSTTGKNTTNTPSNGSCPRHNRVFVRKTVEQASKNHNIKRIITLLIGALILFSTVKLSGNIPAGGVTKECTVDTLGWFGRQGTRTAKIYGMTKREVNRECVKLQKYTSSRIESLRSWELNKSINSKKSIRISLDAILQSPLRVSENVLVSTVETSSILNKATRTASNLAQFVENISVFIRDNTGTVLGLSLATILLMLLVIEQQIMLPWVGFKKLVTGVSSLIGSIPLTKTCKGVKYGVIQISSVFVEMLKKGTTNNRKSSPPAPNVNRPNSNTAVVTRRTSRLRRGQLAT